MQPMVMVVDDEQKVRKYLFRLLEKRGFHVVTAADGPRALQQLEQGDFDIVLLDVLMPGLDGISVLKEIKSRKPFTEVIILTGNASVNLGSKACSSVPWISCSNRSIWKRCCCAWAKRSSKGA